MVSTPGGLTHFLNNRTTRIRRAKSRARRGWCAIEMRPAATSAPIMRQSYQTKQCFKMCGTVPRIDGSTWSRASPTLRTYPINIDRNLERPPNGCPNLGRLHISDECNGTSWCWATHGNLTIMGIAHDTTLNPELNRGVVYVVDWSAPGCDADLHLELPVGSLYRCDHSVITSWLMWDCGAVQAIGASTFLVVGVDYNIHLCQGYFSSDAANCGSKVRATSSAFGRPSSAVPCARPARQPFSSRAGSICLRNSGLCSSRAL